MRLTHELLSSRSWRVVLSGIGGAAFSCILVPASSVSLDRYLRDRYLTIGDDGTLVLLSMVFLISACMAEALFVQVAKRAHVDFVRLSLHGVMTICGLFSIIAWAGSQIALPAQIVFTIYNGVYVICLSRRLLRSA